MLVVLLELVIDEKPTDSLHSFALCLLPSDPVVKKEHKESSWEKFFQETR